MKIVDCTVLVDFYVGEDAQKEASRALLREDADWISVGLWRYEFGNVLLKYVRVGRLGAAEMELALEEVPGLLVETVEDIAALEVWRLSLESRLSYYDAAYVWLARSRNSRLYTRDSGILKKCPDDSAPLPGLS
jgi:predicted nucleic acid-binding protein